MGRAIERINVFQVIADPTRRRLLEMLGSSELTVNEIASEFDVTLSAVSQHLRVLRLAGLVIDERRGRERVYRLNPDPLQEVHSWVTQNVERFWQRKLAILGDKLKEQ